MTTLIPAVLQSRIYMDTVVTIQVVGDAGPRLSGRLDRAFGWFREVERRCSRFDPDSELRRLCNQPGVAVDVSDLLYRTIEFAVTVAETSGGAFDPAVGALMERRGFNRNYRSGVVTSSDAACARASYRDVVLDPASCSVTLLHPLTLDLGAVAKGLAIDLAAAELAGVEGLMINAGGDILVRGLSPSGGDWRIGVRDPLAPDRVLTMLSPGDGAVCSSGGYERPADGFDGHHIVEPRAGRSPAGVAGVTVVAPSAMVADALSTAVFVFGPEAGLAFADAQGVAALLVDDAGRVSSTDSMKGYL